MTCQQNHIHVLADKCNTAFDSILGQIRLRSSKDAAFQEAEIRDKQQQFRSWAYSYGTSRTCSSTLSLDYKFRHRDYPRATIQSELGHLLEDLEGLDKMCKSGEGQEGKSFVNRITGILDELDRFLNRLPKELWLEPDDIPSAVAVAMDAWTRLLRSVVIRNVIGGWPLEWELRAQQQEFSAWVLHTAADLPASSIRSLDYRCRTRPGRHKELLDWIQNMAEFIYYLAHIWMQEPTVDGLDKAIRIMDIFITMFRYISITTEDMVVQ
ncbi:hypothetical protein NM208_g8245 [Fusarium decemcellulare]|uniref:Uncharacterized protein n=1 Tax=Fusarium decemcellulare TaxID=57161 RepID=A0ACC1S611_9HYPO|nr:hypothetical protein NM208_g8245 [Fusarium decemcellulare]